MIRDSYTLKEELIETLLTTQGASQPKDNDIVIRCPFCGDSQKTLSHGHLHVRIDITDNLPLIFHCFRCDATGIFSAKTLNELGLGYSPDMSVGLLRYNKSSTKAYNRKLGIKDNGFDFIVKAAKNHFLADKKKSYLEDRLGVNLSYEEWAKLKVVFNLQDFIEDNEIKSLTTKPGMCRLLNNNYVGFLSVRNEFIVFRNIFKDKNIRYYKYMIKNIMDKTNKMYIIPSKVDALSTEKVNINISEGTFDALGLYFNVFNQDNERNLYAAVCGCGFKTTCKYFLKKGIIGKNVVINIFSDKDKDKKFYKSIVQEIAPLVGEINLFYNDLGKDYGVKKEEISLIKSTLYKLR